MKCNEEKATRPEPPGRFEIDMGTFISRCRNVFAFLMLSIGVVQAGSPDLWPEAPRLTELATPYGLLGISHSDYIYEARLLLDNTPVEPEITGRLSIRHAFETPGQLAALISISEGDDACPVVYRWVTLKASGYQVSPPFGSCSEHIKASASAKMLTVETPARDAPGQVEVYVYDGVKVRKK